ncbi:MAG: pyridoxamine 5'-phosphate oxidase family protein [Candidatus Doudnabacteria bacterium]|nr:pyridoxamine 5'-phosphate oxidase family protein [Candidatus Doudnabacteria bacterium]
MEDLKVIAKEILDSFHLMNLGTQDENGVWVSTVHYVSDADLNLYWLSSDLVRHSKAVLNNSKVAGTITVSTKPGDPNVGLQFEGLAEKLDGNHPELAKKHAAKRNKPEPQVGELEKGRSWYRLKPTKIQIIHEPNWGFNKQTIEL